MEQNSKRGSSAMDDQKQKGISRKSEESSDSAGRGLNSSEKETRERVSSEDGKASHDKGTGREWNSEGTRKGGEKSAGGR